MRKGMTLLEIIMACLLLSVIMGLLCTVFVMGASSWKKARNSIEVDESVQVALARIGSELRQTGLASITIDTNLVSNDTICFLSPYDDTGNIDFDIYNNTPEWVKYVIYYFARDPSGDSVDPPFTAYKILKKEIQVSGENYGTEPVDNVLLGMNPVYYLSNPHPNLSPQHPEEGRVVARNISELEFSLNDAIIDINIKGQKAKEKNILELTSSIYIRN